MAVYHTENEHLPSNVAPDVLFGHLKTALAQLEDLCETEEGTSNFGQLEVLQQLLSTVLQKHEEHSYEEKPTIAILGPTSIGKSTFLNLLMLISLISQAQYSQQNTDLKLEKAPCVKEMRDIIGARNEGRKDVPKKEKDLLEYVRNSTIRPPETPQQPVENDLLQLQADYEKMVDDVKGLCQNKITPPTDYFLLKSHQEIPGKITSVMCELRYGECWQATAEYMTFEELIKATQVPQDEWNLPTKLARCAKELIVKVAGLSRDAVIFADSPIEINKEEELVSSIRGIIGTVSLYLGRGKFELIDRHYLKSWLDSVLTHYEIVKKITIFAPCALFRYVNLLDAPGTGDCSALSYSQTVSAISSANTVLVLMRNTMNEAEPENNFLLENDILRRYAETESPRLILCSYPEKDQKLTIDLMRAKLPSTLATWDEKMKECNSYMLLCGLKGLHDEQPRYIMFLLMSQKRSKFSIEELRRVARNVIQIGHFYPVLCCSMFLSGKYSENEQVFQATNGMTILGIFSALNQMFYRTAVVSDLRKLLELKINKHEMMNLLVNKERPGSRDDSKLATDWLKNKKKQLEQLYSKLAKGMEGQNGYYREFIKKIEADVTNFCSWFGMENFQAHYFDSARFKLIIDKKIGRSAINEKFSVAFCERWFPVDGSGASPLNVRELVFGIAGEKKFLEYFEKLNGFLILEKEEYWAVFIAKLSEEFSEQLALSDIQLFQNFCKTVLKPVYNLAFESTMKINWGLKSYINDGQSRGVQVIFQKLDLAKKNFPHDKFMFCEAIIDIFKRNLNAARSEMVRTMKTGLLSLLRKKRKALVELLRHPEGPISLKLVEFVETLSQRHNVSSENSVAPEEISTVIENIFSYSEELVQNFSTFNSEMCKLHGIEEEGKALLEMFKEGRGDPVPHLQQPVTIPARTFAHLSECTLLDRLTLNILSEDLSQHSEAVLMHLRRLVADTVKVKPDYNNLFRALSHQESHFIMRNHLAEHFIKHCSANFIGEPQSKSGGPEVLSEWGNRMKKVLKLISYDLISAQENTPGDFYCLVAFSHWSNATVVIHTLFEGRVKMFKINSCIPTGFCYHLLYDSKTKHFSSIVDLTANRRKILQEFRDAMDNFTESLRSIWPDFDNKWENKVREYCERRRIPLIKGAEGDFTWFWLEACKLVRCDKQQLVIDFRNAVQHNQLTRISVRKDLPTAITTINGVLESLRKRNCAVAEPESKRCKTSTANKDIRELPRERDPQRASIPREDSLKRKKSSENSPGEPPAKRKKGDGPHK